MRITTIALAGAAVLLSGGWFATFAQSPQIYAPNGTYLGNLNTNRFDPNSVSNPFGPYGSQFSPNSINNQFGPYGSQFSPNGARNPFTH